MQWPPRPGPGIERHEPKGLGLGRVDHFPDVDAHGVVNDLKLVDEGDIDGAKDVLGELDRLGGRGRRDRHGAHHQSAIKRVGEFERRRVLRRRRSSGLSLCA